MERPAADETVRVAPVPEIAGLSDFAPIGRGGFADVYRAYQRAFDREVAVKVLNRLDARIVELFQRECRSAGRLGWHDNVVSVYATGRTEDGRPFLCMEYLPHGSLAQSIGSGGTLPWRRLRWEDVTSIGVQLSSALGAAHRAGMLHRDVKPGNVLQEPLADGVRVKLSDFGIAGVLVDETPEHELTGTAYQFLSVGYAAPEALGRSQVVDHLSDLYSLGATMYVLLTGLPMTGRSVDLSTIGVPDPLIALIDDLTDALRENRPTSASEVGGRLQELQRESGLPVDRLTLERTAPVKARFDSSRTVRAVAQGGMRRPRTDEGPDADPPAAAAGADAAQARADAAGIGEAAPDAADQVGGASIEPIWARPTDEPVAEHPGPVPRAAAGELAEDLEDATPTIEVSSLSSLIADPAPDVVDEPAPAFDEPAPAPAEDEAPPEVGPDHDRPPRGEEPVAEAASDGPEGIAVGVFEPVPPAPDDAPAHEPAPDVAEAVPVDEGVPDGHDRTGDDREWGSADPMSPPADDTSAEALHEADESDVAAGAAHGTPPGPEPVPEAVFDEVDSNLGFFERPPAEDRWPDAPPDDADLEDEFEDERPLGDEPAADAADDETGDDPGGDLVDAGDDVRDDHGDDEDAADGDDTGAPADPADLPTVDDDDAAGTADESDGRGPDVAGRDVGYWGAPPPHRVYTSIGDVVQPDPPGSWRRPSEPATAERKPPTPPRRTTAPQGVDRRDRWSSTGERTADRTGVGDRPVVPVWAQRAEPPTPETRPAPTRSRAWDVAITILIVVVVVATIVTAGLLVLR
ncbi:MAG: protein kinase [Actinomycetota bacterium]|nr:protein kinase [Actinomycetota bacterium]